MQKNKCLFSLGEFNKKHLILFFFAPITYFINFYSVYYYENKDKPVTETIQTFSNYLGYIIIHGSIYLFFYLKRICKKKKEKDIRIDKEIDKKKTILFIFMIILDLSYSFLLILLFKPINMNYDRLMCLEVIFLWIFSFIILKNEIIKNKHQLISIIIMIIGLIILTPSLLSDLKVNNSHKSLLIIGFILLHFINSIHYIIGHHIFYNCEFNFYLGLLILGFIGIIFILIISFINYLENYNSLNLFNDFSIFLKKNNIYDLIKYITINSFINGIDFTVIWLIFKFFKPWFYGTIIIINTLILRIYIKYNKKENIKVYEIILYIILIFTTLVFNEQIICNFLGLNENTKIDIINRSEKDTYRLLQESAFQTDTDTDTDISNDNK